MKNKFSSRLDGTCVSNNLIKHASTTFAKPLTLIINHTYTHWYIPKHLPVSNTYFNMIMYADDTSVYYKLDKKLVFGSLQTSYQ